MKLTYKKFRSVFCLTLILIYPGAIELCNAQNIEYRTENKLHELAPAKISLAVMSMESFLFPVTFGLGAEGQIMDKLHYQANYRQGVIRNYMIPADHVLSEQKESKGLYIDASAEWVFKDKTKPGRVKVITSSSYNTYYSTQSYFIADCDVRRYWAFSGGISNYTRPSYFGNDSSEYIISGGNSMIPGADQVLHSNLNTLSFFGGLTFRKIRKSAVISGGYRYRRFYAKRFYMQLLSGYTSAGDFTYLGKNYKLDNVKQNALGYKIGWQWDEMGVVTGVEFGKQPGITLTVPESDKKESNEFFTTSYLNYAKLTFHFNLWNSDKNYALRNKK